MKRVAVLAGVVLAGTVHALEVDTLSAVDTRGADIIVVGEIHDNPVHHAGQAELIRRVGPSALVFEMINPSQAVRAEEVGAESGAEALATAIAWEESGWPDFSIYYQVFAAADDAALYGAALPREEVRAAFEAGPAPAFGDDAARFGLDVALPAAEQSEREAGQLAAHCNALPDDTLPGMVAAQRLRDAHFARVSLEALEKTGGPVVLITGNGHARTDWGVPAAILRAAPEVKVVSIGQLEAPPEQGAPYDVWRVTPAAERGDPCEALR